MLWGFEQEACKWEVVVVLMFEGNFWCVLNAVRVSATPYLETYVIRIGGSSELFYHERESAGP